MHVNVNDVSGKVISPGVAERILLKDDQSKPGGLSVRHYVLTKGGQVVFEEPLTEYQHYIIQGCTTQGGPSGDLLQQDSALFVPCNSPWPDSKNVRRHVLGHAGEGEVRILTLAYKASRPAFRWAKSRSNNLHKVPQYHSSSSIVGYTQLFTEEQHAVMGAMRMHGVDIQTNPTGVSLPDHRNPEEIMYILRGNGVGLAEGKTHDIRPGSLLYTPEGETHGIRVTNETLQYVVVEFIEHDKMWAERSIKK